MKSTVFVSLFLVGLLTVLAVRAAPTHACPEGCGVPSTDQSFATPFYSPLGGYLFSFSSTTGAQQPAIAYYPYSGLWKYTQVAGHYCTDKTGGQVYVPTDAPVPSGVTCGAVAMSPSPSPSSAPSSSPAPTARPTQP